MDGSFIKVEVLRKLNDARLKIAVCAAAVLLINIADNIRMLLAAGMLVTVFGVCLIIKKRFRLLNMIPILFMALIIAISRSITVGSQVVFKIDFMGITVNLYNEGLTSGLMSFLRIFSSAGAVLMVMASIGINEFIKALRWFRMPGAFIEVLVIALKYIFIFKEDIFNIQKAQRARLGYASFSKSAFSIGSLGGILLSRSFDKSKALARAMKSRGYNGKDFV